MTIKLSTLLLRTEFDMKVILHADDFGYDKDTLDATIDCFKKGALTSCTVMSNCTASEDAFEFARKHPEFSYGVHLTFVDGLKPVMPAKKIPAFVDEKGFFLPSNAVRHLAIILKLPKKQIIAESQAQIDKMEKAGVKVSHLDSHGHLHKFFSILWSLKFLKIGGKPVKKVRATQNIYLVNPSWYSPAYWLNKYFNWYLRHNFKNPDYFYMSASNMDTGWADLVLEKMEKLPHDAVIEIGVHPGHQEKWRQHEYDDIIDFATKLKKSGKHHIINWHQL